MATQEPKKWFDGTVNWGLILTLIAFGVGAIGFGNKMVTQVETLTGLVEVNARETKAMREDINSIRLDMAKADGIRATVADHESRIRQLERGN